MNPALCQRMARDECKVVIIAEFLLVLLIEQSKYLKFLVATTAL